MTTPTRSTRIHRHPAPFGVLSLVADARGLRAVCWPDREPAPGDPALDDRLPVAADGLVVDPDDILALTAMQLDEYFAGERTDFDVPLAPAGTPFQQAAWAVLRTIPYGATMSYGQQAAAMGDRNKARAVGAANGKNPLPIIVPCHRVRGADGRLTGFGGGLDTKAWLLDLEQRVMIGSPVESR